MDQSLLSGGSLGRFRLATVALVVGTRKDHLLTCLGSKYAI